MDYKAALESYGYKLVTWEEFLSTTDRPEGLLERANDWREDNVFFPWVVYDPSDDDCGFMLLSNDAEELAQETCEYISGCFPDEGPLAVVE